MQPDAEIVRDVLRGDRTAFAALVARHERAAWATARRVLRDDHAAADAAQEAFLLAFRRLGDLQRPERFGVWLLRIARREAVRMARARARSPDHAFDEPAEEPFEASRLSADSEELLAAVARLPEHERLVVALHYLEGRTVAEVASALGRPVGTVTKQLSRAIGRLRLKTGGVIG
ncbi:RNA polymerase sigma factor [Paludisphaera mucosa]|uniref:Sigma-70 family RNA polymerase sigma factor n=1 Tax=Paludisphaera mucosa TaxID=3030827 RepID=A0ABT6FB72_9BACT|nr:sigma-70 family RNA polymerase sigma factor [Paludisphaera mucosa]MDG3004630.1 sigma-70 family RNA polymerase sigma factor [Paludisphaera mucosa]